MKKTCRYCFTRLKPESSVCRVCRIDSAKDKSALTAGEKNIAYRCRTLYTIGFLCIVGGLAGAFLLLPLTFFFLRGQTSRNLATPSALLPYYTAAMLVLNISLPVFGLAVRRYKKWSYPVGIVIFSSFVLIHLPGLSIAPVLGAGLFLYLLATPSSKHILVH